MVWLCTVCSVHSVYRILPAAWRVDILQQTSTRMRYSFSCVEYTSSEMVCCRACATQSICDTTKASQTAKLLNAIARKMPDRLCLQTTLCKQQATRKLAHLDMAQEMMQPVLWLSLAPISTQTPVSNSHILYRPVLYRQTA